MVLPLSISQGGRFYPVIDCSLHRRLRVNLFSHVACDKDRLAASLVDGVGDILGGIVRQAHYNDLRTVFRELVCNRFSDARISTGDDR